MPIKYALFENNLTSDPDDFAAHVEITATANMETIAQHMLDQGSTVTSADILAVLEDAIKACEALLLEGYSVNLGGLVRLQPSIKGIFHGANDKFDPSRHRVDVGATPGTRVRNKIRHDGKVKKDEAIMPLPDLITFQDVISHTTNTTATPNGIGTIIGHRLKFDPNQPDEGIFFKVAGMPPEIKVTYVQRNMPAELIFINPATLVPGTQYYIFVRARVQGGTELRAGRLNITITAA